MSKPMMKLTPDEDTPLGSRQGWSEQELRIQLAAAYRLAHHFGWDNLIFNHITVRVPGPNKHFLINHYGLSYDEITATNLLKIDLDDNLVDGPSNASVNQAGFIIHGAIHGAREDLHCIMHTHTVAGTAISAIEPGLLSFSQDSMALHGRIGYHDYEGIVCDPEERNRILADIGELPALVLRNHGLLTAAPTVAGAFIMMYFMEQACRSQVALLSMGQKVFLPQDSVAMHTAAQYWQGPVPPQKYGHEAFAALMRRLDRIDPSYRH